MPIPALELAEHLSTDCLILLFCIFSACVRVYVQYYTVWNISLFYSTASVLLATLCLSCIMSSEWWLLISAHDIKRQYLDLLTEWVPAYMFLPWETRSTALKLVFTARILYFSGLWAAKLSWLCLFDSAARVQEAAMRYRVWGALGTLAVSYFLNLFLVVFWCGQPRRYWMEGGKGVCLPWHSPTFLAITTVLNILTELHILQVGYKVLCPLSLLRNPSRNKFEATWLVFGVTGVAIIMSVGRAIACFVVYREMKGNRDEMEDLGTMFSHLEMMAHITVACTPSYRACHHWWRERRSTAAAADRLSNHAQPSEPETANRFVIDEESSYERNTSPRSCYDPTRGGSEWVEDNNDDQIYRAGSPGPSIRDGVFGDVGSYGGTHSNRYGQGDEDYDEFEEVDLDDERAIPMRSLNLRRLSPISEHKEKSMTQSLPIN